MYISLFLSLVFTAGGRADSVLALARGRAQERVDLQTAKGIVGSLCRCLKHLHARGCDKRACERVAT